MNDYEYAEQVRLMREHDISPKAAPERCGLRTGDRCAFFGTIIERECAICPFCDPRSEPDLCVVIASKDNGDDLLSTLRSIEETAPDAECLVIDDGSKIPEPFATQRLETNIGLSKARIIGARMAQSEIVLLTDGHMGYPALGLRKVARLAQVIDGFAYAGPDGHYAADMRHAGGLLRCVWGAQPKMQAEHRTGLMGACYAIPRKRLEDMGGWIGLPFPWGWDEEAMSIRAYLCGVPIMALRDVQTTHRWGGQIPREWPLGNLAAMHRILWPDPLWALWRRRLMTGFEYEGPEGSAMRTRVSAALIEQAEAPEIVRYGAALRERYVKDPLDFYLEAFNRA